MSGAVFITGASAGIGAACAKVFAREGRELILAARRLDRLQALQQELQTTTHVFQLDVTDEKAVQALVQREAELFDRVEVLLNNAGMAVGRDPLPTGKTSDWDQMIDLNVKGFLYVLHAVLPIFVRHNRGHVVNLSSAAGHYMYPGGNVYAASKFAVKGLTEGLRMDLHAKNIRVTSISPGMVETEFSVVRFGDEEKAKAVYQGFTPLNAEDVADAVHWAVSRPAHVNIADILMFPTAQSRIDAVHRT